MELWSNQWIHLGHKAAQPAKNSCSIENTNEFMLPIGIIVENLLHFLVSLRHSNMFIFWVHLKHKTQSNTYKSQQVTAVSIKTHCTILEERDSVLINRALWFDLTWQPLGIENRMWKITLNLPTIRTFRSQYWQRDANETP